MWQHGHFYWNELMTRDPEGAKAFYGETLGWTFDGVDMGDDGMYWVCKDGDQPIGGIFNIDNTQFDDMPICWFAYIAVDDLDARLEKATKAGGSIQRPAFNVPGIGRIALLKDPTGAAIGWMTPAPSDS
jgi:predicted enzyme related to lactoylglutathione lyase